MERLTAIAREDGKTTFLAAPKLGVFEPRIADGELVRGGAVVGVLKVLARRFQIVAPASAHGIAAAVASGPLGYAEPLLRLEPLDPSMAAGAISAASSSSAAKTGALVVRAPIHGIFYRRASPESPLFVEVGQTVKLGQTIGLIEVMKTFNPVLYQGEGLPDGAQVVATPVNDRQEIEAGAVVLEVKA